MGTKKNANLADRMKPPARVEGKDSGDSRAVLDGSFKKSAAEEFDKRLTLDLTAAQHKKIKIHAMVNDTTMNQLMRDYIDSLE